MTKQLHITCRYTGLQATIDMPAIPGKTLEYTHPLSHIESVEQVLAESRAYIRRLDKPILAALAITTLKHYQLYTPTGDAVHPAAINANMCLCDKSVLLKLIDVIREYVIPTIDRIKAKNVPTVALYSIPANSREANLWTKKLAVSLLEDMCGMTSQRGDDEKLEDTVETKAGEVLKISEDPTIASVKEENNKRRIAEIYRQVETRRQVRAELLEKAKKAKTVFTLADLDNTQDGTSTVAEFFKANDQSIYADPINNLYKLLLKNLADSNIIQTKQKQVLSAIGTGLFTLEQATRDQVAGKLNAMGSKYATGLAHLIQLTGCKGTEQQTAALAMLEPAEKKETLIERLARLKGAK